MSEESKTPDADYVHMGDGAGVVPGGAVKMPPGLDDPNLSQEDRDMRLALALQQQENAAAYDQHRKKHNAFEKADEIRTTRSNVQTRLTEVRRKDGGKLSVPGEFTTENAYVADLNMNKAPIGSNYVPPPKNALPQEIADFKMAADMQKVEQTMAGASQAIHKIIKEENEDMEAQRHRTERSNYHLPSKPKK